MNSIFKVTSFIEVWESDLSKLVSTHYGRPWRYIEGMEGRFFNGSYEVIDIDAADEIDFWCGENDNPAQVLADWKALPYPCSDKCLIEHDYSPEYTWGMDMHFERDHTMPREIILNDLCKKGEIEAGHYLINIWW